MYIEIEKCESICLDHWLNMIEHTCDPKNIEQTNVMRETKECIEKILTFGRSEGEVRVRLISCRLLVVFIEIHHVRMYIYWRIFLTRYIYAGIRIEQNFPLG